MIVKDKDGKVSAVSVRYHGVDVYISKDMFTGENKSINRRLWQRFWSLPGLIRRPVRLWMRWYRASSDESEGRILRWII